MKVINNLNKNRENLRKKGQFWTPPWVAKAMISYILDPKETILDLGVGAGAFYDALLDTDSSAESYSYEGIDIDDALLEQLNKRKISNKHSFKHIDYITERINEQFGSIISNPPYIRHHRLSPDVKNELAKISKNILGKKIDGRAGIHVYFLLLALNNLKKNGKLAFIMPADTCEGVFAKDLWKYISTKYCLEAVITFSASATPFPNIDTNAIIFLIKNSAPEANIYKVQCNTVGEDLLKVVKSNFTAKAENVIVTEIELKKALKIGFSRDANLFKEHTYKLKDFAKIVRGIATGENSFFFMTDIKRKELGLDKKYFIRAIGRTRDLQDNEEITNELLTKLDRIGRPTYLLYLNGASFDTYSSALQQYIKEGEKQNINKKVLISTRNPWYKMENRQAPQLLFAYLGRRNLRFIKNHTNVVPLTSFLCVYPNKTDKEYIEKLWRVLNDPDTIANLQFSGKSYGSGAIKVEPRGLDNLAIPDHVLKKYNLLPDDQLLISYD